MADLVSSDLTYTQQRQGGRFVHRISSREKRVLVQVAFPNGGETYPSGGVPLTSTPSDVGLIRSIRRWEIVDGSDASGILWKVDHSNLKLRGYEINTPAISAQDLELVASSTTQKILHNADPATNLAATVVYAHVGEVVGLGNLQIGHLETIDDDNANNDFLNASGGSYYGRAEDQDLAATGGTQVYFDEDATLGARLLADLSSIGNSADLWIPMAGGQAFLKITHNATPSSPGVALYSDGDGANQYDRLAFVSPTTTDGTEALWLPGFTAVSTADGSMVELDGGSDDPGAQTLFMYAYGW